MNSPGPKFDRKAEAAIAALLTQRTTEDAARVAGVSHSTLLRWMKLEEFDKQYRQARRDAYGQSIARLQQGCSAAVSVLLKVMADPASPPSVRVRAADSVLDHSAKNIELEDIEARLAAIERETQANKDRGGR